MAWTTRRSLKLEQEAQISRGDRQRAHQYEKSRYPTWWHALGLAISISCNMHFNNNNDYAWVSVKKWLRHKKFMAGLMLGTCFCLLLSLSITLGYAIFTGRSAFFQTGAMSAGRALSKNPGDSSLLPPPPLPEMKDMAISRDEALSVNQNIPFIKNGLEQVSPFRLDGNPVDRSRAAVCLALAGFYEAGDDPVGQAAVDQVILNRVRHRAFPKSICGVVFQGQERQTGCQFSFTCDGAMTRRKPSEAQWARALATANSALSGYVFGAVGAATHYHTNWVVAYWSPSMEKIGQVGTHLFFRWPGYYGTAKSLTGAYSGGELLAAGLEKMGELAAAVVATQMPTDMRTTTLLSDPTRSHRVDVAGVGASDMKGNRVRLSNPDVGQFMIQLEKSAYPGSYAVLANSICEARAVCQIVGWTDPTRMPASLPITSQIIASASFHYLKDAGHTTGQARWNCNEFKGRSVTQCIQP